MSAGADPRLDADVEVRRRSMIVEAQLSVGSGERLALFGSSGAGKTTILEAIAGLATLQRGSVRVDGQLVATSRRRWRQSRREAAGGDGAPRRQPALLPRQRGIALVRQPTSLFPHLTVKQNIAYGVRVRGPAPGNGSSPPRDGSGSLSSGVTLEELMERLGVAELTGARPLGLSGGQRQRVALGRALASPFRVLLLDEPLSALDHLARSQLRELVIEVAAARQAAAIVVTHDLPEAQAYATSLGIIEDGKILQIGQADEVVAHPASRRVARLVGYAGFVPDPTTRAGLYAIHPDRVVPGADTERGVVLSGVVAAVRPYGPRLECELVLRDATRVAVRMDECPSPGSRLTVTALDPPLISSAVDLDGD